MMTINSFARHFAGRKRLNQTIKPRRTLKRAARLSLCLMLVLQGLVLSSLIPVKAQRQADLGRGARQPAQKTLDFVPTTQSQGAQMDLEIQRNAARYSVAQGRSEAPSNPTIFTDEQPNPLAPPISTTFDAINFNEDASLNGFFHIPPDNSGAAGPNHVVNVTNTSIEWYTKGGVRQNRQRLDNFFAPVSPVNNTFDPKVIYDQYAGRFVVLTMERVDTGTAVGNSSRVFIAVSDNSDPNGSWFYLQLNTMLTISGLPAWADFPGLAVDSEAIYFTTNTFRFAVNGSGNTGFRLYIIPKQPFYSGGAVTPPTPINPVTASTPDPVYNTTVNATSQPTQMYGDTPGGLGTFLVAYSGLTDGANALIQVIRVDNPLTTPTLRTRLVPWGTQVPNANGTYSNAPQRGSARLIATNDPRVSQNGVWRNDQLYMTAPTAPSSGPDANQVTVHWWRVDTTGSGAPVPAYTIPDQGNIGGEDIATGTFTFFPSLSVDSAGNMAVGFAASGPNIYPGSYYTGRLAVDPPGTTQPAAGLRAGRDFYVRTFNSATAASRWGDYSGFWLDPSDETSFWVFNQNALTRGTTGVGSQPAEDGRWGTAWGKFSMATPAAPAAAGSVIISEFRLRGPGGANDEFIELYNASGADIVVNDATPIGGQNGWAIVTGDNPAVAKAIIPTGTTIKARGHYLIANNAPGGFTLASYGGAGAATPDLTYSVDIPENRGIALFNTANPVGYTLANRLDAVGSTTTEVNPIYKEGTGYPDYTPGITSEHSFFRDMKTGGIPKDTDNNQNDFLFVATNGSCGFPVCSITPTDLTAQRLGAPGPENLSSPINRSELVTFSLLDPLTGASSPPNRVRDLTPVTNGANGTLDVRRTITNYTGQTITRIRFRFIEITTFPNPAGIADLRALTSSDIVVTVNGNPVTVRGTTLEEPPTQPNGGGWNSSMSFTATVTPIAPLGTVNVHFLYGVQVPGNFRTFVIVEVLP